MSIYRVPINVTWTGPGSPGVNVWHVRAAAGVQAEDANLQQAVNALHTFYDGLKTNGTPTGAVMAKDTRFSLGNIVNVETQQVAHATFADVVCTNGGQDAAPALQIVVGWRTSLAARRGQGRTFLGPLDAQTVAADGSIGGATRSWVLQMAGNLRVTSTGGGEWSIGVYGLQVPKKQGGSAKVLRDIVGETVNTSFSVLRSRRD